MKQIIIYGSQYGSTQRYAEKLSEQTSIPAVSYNQLPDLSEMKTIIYLGGLYAGGVLGLKKALRFFPVHDEFKLILVTVGLADPKDSENQENIDANLQKQLPEKLLHQTKIFHLRGAIDYKKLNVGHKALMALLYQSVRKTAFEKLTAENRAFIETYGKQADFIDFQTLQPILQEIQKEII